MPNTIPAAGEAMPEVTLEAMIARHNAALAAANNCAGPLEDTPEEVEMHAAIEAFVDSTATLTSYAGVLDALRLAAKENEDFHGSEVSETLVKGVLAFLEERENEEKWFKAKRLGKELAAVLEEIGEHDFAFIRPAHNEFAVCFGALPHDGPDPLLLAVNAYVEGSKAFEADPSDLEDQAEQDAAVARTYGPPLEVLENWDRPAQSREAVVASLELILSENLIEDQYGENLIRACIPFVKGEMI